MVSINEEIFFKGKWQFSDLQSVRPQPIRWRLESNEAYFRISNGNHKIEIRFSYRTMTDKKWEGSYITLSTKEESVGLNGSEGAPVRFDYEDGIWKGNPSGYACRINWFVKKIS